YLVSDSLAIRGQLGVMKNYVCYFGGKNGVGEGSDTTAICIPYKDIMNLELVNSKKVLGPDSIQISIKEKSFSFALFFNKKDVFRIIYSLTNAAMNRLVKGAETSISASSDMYAKGNTTGDLASNLISRGGGLLGRPREEISFTMENSLSLVDNFEEEDFTDHKSTSRINLFSGRSLSETELVENEKNEKVPKSTISGNGIGLNDLDHSLLNYAQIITAKINTIDELNQQIRHVEFRNLFRLPLSETISLEEIPCYIWNKTNCSSATGNLYLSQNFVNYASLASGSSSIISLSVSPSVTNQVASDIPNVTISPGLSMLFDSPQEPTVVFAIPYPHIVSVMKQPPTALSSTMGKLQAISLSGFLVISTKSRQEFWLSFGTTKSRDRVVDVLLAKMKQVDWRFDDDVNVGIRNGGPILSSSPSTSFSPSFNRRSTQMSSPNDSFEDDLNLAGLGLDRSLDSSYKAHIHAVGGISTQIMQIGLKFLFETENLVPGSHNSGSPKRANGDSEFLLNKTQKSAGEIAWQEYLDVNGKDVCMTKDLKSLREMLMKIDGIPSKLRGDLWMLFAGAWYSRPEKDYYRKLVHDNIGRISPFTEEIEKDVRRRSLPEHPAYQSAIGIDALRRLLTAYSWRNPSIGYAQALNIISAVLLLHLREEDAFWMLCTIVERILPDHYTKTLVGSVVDQSVFSYLVQIYMPNLWAHITKLYMDLSMVSVPWFVCLFLNSVQLKVGTKILDCFFLDGPKFLFWLALSILKVNEKRLIQKGKDDDIFVRILKDFFQRLGSADSPPIEIIQQQDPVMLNGRSLFDYVLSVAYGTFAPVVTTDTIEYLRMKFRLRVVHQMEDTSRKSQIRTLSEQVALGLDEVGIVYDEVRSIEFSKEELAQQGIVEKDVQKVEEEEEIKSHVFRQGGWGMVSMHKRTLSTKSANGNWLKTTSRTSQPPEDHKSLSLIDFRKVFNKVSPWRSSQIVNKRISKPKEPQVPAMRQSASLIGTSSSGLRSSTSGRLTPDYSTQSNTLNNQTPTNAEDTQIQLIDRVYFYCALHFHFLQSRNRPTGQSSYDTNSYSSVGGAGMGSNSSNSSSTSYTVDLATIVHVLDIIMKQPLQSRMRFLFDVHDLDGDGFLNKSELKAVMDSLLEMFERARLDGFGRLGTTSKVSNNSSNSDDQGLSDIQSDDGDSMKSGKPLEDEELYLRAVSSFLTTALKLGNNKQNGLSTGLVTSTNNSGMKKSSSANVSELSKKPSLTMPKMEETEDEIKEQISESRNSIANDKYSLTESSQVSVLEDSVGSAAVPRRRKGRSASVSSPSVTTFQDLNIFKTNSIRRQSGIMAPRSAPLGSPGNTEEIFKLSFNEFLLAVLSQSVFVQFFERTWKLKRVVGIGVSGGSDAAAGGKTVLDW
ncbi:hypothetical protein HK096_000513, partial [Nowakowskiella sp. JEL0078]